jgi:hypothetical protein
MRTKGDWGAFLKKYNQEMLSYEGILEQLPDEISESKWLGYAGASGSDILVAEKRLASKLPLSYRAFLKTSNGWRLPSTTIISLLSSSKITWFRDENQDWIDAYAQTPPVSDKEYLVYGEKQDCGCFRAEYLNNALQVSEVSDSAVLLLNPEIVTPDGEWETWLFANWLPGAVRYRSFGDWFQTERETSRKLLKPARERVSEKASAKKSRSMKQARIDALKGQTEEALEFLEHFASKGDNSAAASLAELYAFLNQWDRVISNAGRLIADPEAVYAGNVFDDMVNLLGRAGHHTGEWKRIIEVVTAARVANKNRSYDEGDRPVSDRYEKILENLVKYAARQRRPPHKLIEIIHEQQIVPDITLAQRKASFRDGVENVYSYRPDLKNKPQERAQHCFSLAVFYGLEDEALELYDANDQGSEFLMKWDAAVYIARIHVRRANADAAWAVILPKIGYWQPCDRAQVAPVVLLIDEYLQTIMTPERCRLVLKTARGN